MYSKRPIASDGEFPPTPSKKYVKLAVVEHANEICDLKETRKKTLHGRVAEMLVGKEKIEVVDILKPQDNGSPVSLVFVEGPPGIGKSTLAWELCRRWDRNRYDLVVLLRLRDPKVQKLENVGNLFPHVDQHLQESVAKEVMNREGKGVLFVLDGFDELPKRLRYQGLLFELLKGEILPGCSVVLTSRPSASKDLYLACSNAQIQRHVEILGFTQDCVKDYATSILSSEPELLKSFLTYISVSKNPAINSLMYIPLNAAIMVHIYKDNWRKGCTIPKTLTQVYTQLCLTLLKRYIESISADPQEEIVLEGLSDLPTSHDNNFKKLAKLAFEQFEKHEVVFYSRDVPKNLVHFGFLDSVSSLYGGGGVSYNFLHLTLQEFLTAYHITQLSNGIEIFNRHFMDERWEVVWRFISGLTELQFFKDKVKCDAFALVTEEDEEHLSIKDLLLHCLFEGQVEIDYMAALGNNAISSKQYASSPMDRYVLGYCIANSSSSTSWKVEIGGGSGESFMWGLKTNRSSCGTISHLVVTNITSLCIDSYPQCILHGISHLDVAVSDKDRLHSLMKAFQLMTNLTSLHVEFLSLEISQEIMNDIAHSNVMILELKCDVGSDLVDESFLKSLRYLINSPSGTLNDLTIRFFNGDDVTTKPLCDVLFGPSSLNQLTLDLSNFSENCFDLLETNTCLTTVRIVSTKLLTLSLQLLAQVVRNNQTIEKLHWGHCGLSDIAVLSTPLRHNRKLKELILDVRSPHGSVHIRDSRVKLNYTDVQVYEGHPIISLAKSVFSSCTMM